MTPSLSHSPRHAAFWGALSVSSMAWGWATSNPLMTLAGAGFLGAAVAYIKGPGAFGKRDDGTLPLWSWLAHAPFMASVWLGWALRRRRSREPARHEVVPGVWLGRRPTRAELEGGGIRSVIDLTAELPGVPAPAYLCLPTVDGTAPTEDRITEGVRHLHRMARPVLVHCLAGHSRSATVVAAWLVDAGHAASPEEAMEMLRAARPAAALTDGQQERLRRWARRVSPRPGGPRGGGGVG